MVHDQVQSRSITFPVLDVEVAEKPLEEVDYFRALELCLETPLLACDWQSKPLVARARHAFVSTVYRAFNDHRPLVLSPDHVWLLLAQGMALHIRANAETLRGQFVAYQGKQEIVIQHPNISPDNPLSPWDEGVSAFAREVRARLLQPDGLVASFSTTGDIEKIVYEITLLDAMQAYFELTMTLCGIPSITLEGTTGSTSPHGSRSSGAAGWTHG